MTGIQGVRPQSIDDAGREERRQPPQEDDEDTIRLTQQDELDPQSTDALIRRLLESRVSGSFIMTNLFTSIYSDDQHFDISVS